MAKFTKKAIMACLLELLKTKNIDKITVKDICEKCEINRNTFYYYFCDIYDVLNSIFLDEIEKLVSSKDISSFYDSLGFERKSTHNLPTDQISCVKNSIIYKVCF